MGPETNRWLIVGTQQHDSFDIAGYGQAQGVSIQIGIGFSVGFFLPEVGHKTWLSVTDFIDADACQSYQGKAEKEQYPAKAETAFAFVTS